MRTFLHWKEEFQKEEFAGEEPEKKQLNESMYHNKNLGPTEKIKNTLDSSHNDFREALRGMFRQEPQKPLFRTFSDPSFSPPEAHKEAPTYNQTTPQEPEEIKHNSREEEGEEEEEDFNAPEEYRDFYKLYRDKEETFECNISIEGASLSSAQARLFIDSTIVNLVYYGKLYKDGRCLVQIGKMSFLPEGTRGRIRLEVIVDDTLFSPWESSFIVEGAKKVKVEIKEKKSIKFNMKETK